MCLLILSVLIVSSIGFNATDSKTESLSPAPLSAQNDYPWGLIEVISEPHKNQNTNTGVSNLPKIVVEDGKIYMVWADQNDTNYAETDSDIFYRYFDGNSWSEVQVISEPVPGSGLNDQISSHPDIAVENGNIYVVWHDENNTNFAGTDRDIFFRCNLSGSGWEPVQVISEPIYGAGINTGESYEPSIAVENGKIYVVWRDDNDTNLAGTDFDVFYRCNLTGTGWEPVQVISEPVPGDNLNDGLCYDPEISVENGKIYVVWSDNNDTNTAGGDYDIFYKCNLTGLSWEPVQVISEPALSGDVNDLDSWYPTIEVENGNIYVAWYDLTNYDSSGTDNDIFYRCNLTSGWEDIQVISEPIAGDDNNNQAYRPDIAVENGKIFIVWDDNTNLFSSGTDLDVYLRTNLTGFGWEKIEIISEPVENTNTNLGSSDYQAIAVEHGKIHIAWEDGSNLYGAGAADDDIFYRSTFAPPTLTGNLTPTAGNTSTLFTYEMKYIDPDNEAPAFVKVTIDGIEHTMTGTSPGDTYYADGKDYFYSTQFNIGSNHPYQFSASDGTFTSELGPFFGPDVYNTPPNITTPDNTTAIEDMLYEEHYEYEDIDVANVGQDGIWSLNTNANWLVWDQDNNILHGTPAQDDVGQYWVNVTIFDTFEIDSTNFTLTVLEVDEPPALLTDALPHAPEDALYDLTFDAEDEESTQLYWTIETNASWLTVDNTLGTISGTPTNDEVGGDFWVDVTVNDTKLIDNKNFSLIVDNVNDPPVITTENVTFAAIDKLYSVDYEAADIDPNGDILTWSLATDAGSWLTLNTDTGLLSGTPTADDIGKYYVQIIVTDGHGGIDSQIFTLTVGPSELNQPPIITTKDILGATKNKTYSVDYEATDANTPLNLLTWTLETNASWLSIDKTTGVLSGTPVDSDVGKYWVKVSVGDGEGGFDFHNFTLTVYSKANEPPKIVTSDKLSAQVDKAYSVDYEATDDRTPIAELDWVMKTNASWLSINSNTGVLSGTPKTADVGWYWVNVSVTDNENGWDYHNFTITVTKGPPITPNTKPELTDGEMTPGSGDTDTEFKFKVHYTDADGDPPKTIQVVIDGKAYDMTLVDGEEANGTYQYKTKLSEGEHKYYFTASDDYDSAVGTDDTPTNAANADSTPKISEAEEKEDEGNFVIYIIFIIIIIIIAIVAFALGRSTAPKPLAPPAERPARPPRIVEEEEYPEEEEEYEEEYYPEEEEELEAEKELEGEEPEAGEEELEFEAEEIEEEEWEEGELEEEVAEGELGEELEEELPEEELEEEIEEEISDEELEEEMEEELVEEKPKKKPKARKVKKK